METTMTENFLLKKLADVLQEITFLEKHRDFIEQELDNLKEQPEEKYT